MKMLDAIPEPSLNHNNRPMSILVVVGTENKVKVQAVQELFQETNFESLLLQFSLDNNSLSLQG
jgi:hypothetical protein